MKNSEQIDELREEEDEDDLFDIDFEDMEFVHEFPGKKGGPPPQQKCQYEIIRDQIIADREALMKDFLACSTKTLLILIQKK